MDRVYLLQLPPELLVTIIELVTPSAEDSRLCSKISTLLALRWTCRTFRCLVDLSSLWYDDSFSFETLSRRIKDPGTEFVVDESEERAVRFLSTFAGDAMLLERMGRKRIWEFRSLVALEAVEQLVKPFCDVVKSIHLSFYASSDVNLALRTLFQCQNLVEIHLEQEHDGPVSPSTCSKIARLS